MSARKSNILTGGQLSLFDDIQNNYNFSSREILIDFDGVKIADNEKKQSGPNKEAVISHTVSGVIERIIHEKLCKNADFSDLPISIANVALNSLRDFRLTFPEVPLLDFVGGYRGFRLMSASQGPHHKVGSKYAKMFTRYSPSDKKIFVLINPRCYGRNGAEEPPSDDGFHPPLCNTIKADFEHELGHVLDFSLNAYNDGKIKALFRKLRKNKSVVSKLSEYANENTREFIAEAWSEYYNNPTPREVACTVATRIYELYAQKYKLTQKQ